MNIYQYKKLAFHFFKKLISELHSDFLHYSKAVPWTVVLYISICLCITLNQSGGKKANNIMPGYPVGNCGLSSK